MYVPHIPIPYHDIFQFCTAHHISKSVLTEHFKNSSDVDFLVQFDDTHIPTLSPYFRDDVMKKAYLLYEQK